MVAKIETLSNPTDAQNVSYLELCGRDIYSKMHNLLYKILVGIFS